MAGVWLRGALWLLALNVGVKLVWVVLESRLQNQWGTAAYGRFAALFNLTSLLSIVLDFGTAKAFLRRQTRYGAELHPLWEALIALRWYFLAAYAVAVPLLAWLLGYSLDVWLWLLLLMVYQLGVASAQVLRGLLQARLHLVRDAWLSIAERSFLIITALSLGATLTLTRYGWALVAAALATLIIAVILTRPPLRVKPTTRRQLLLWLRQGLPFAGFALALAVHDRMNLIMVERLQGATAAGHMAAAYRWYGASSMYLWILTPLWFNRLSRISPALSSELRTALTQGVVMLGLPPLMLALWGLQHSYWFLSLIKLGAPGPERAAMSAHLSWLWGALACNAAGVLLGTYLSASGRARLVALAGLAAIAVNSASFALLYVAGSELAGSQALLIGNATLAVLYMAGAARSLTWQTMPWQALVRLVVLGVVTGAALLLMQSAGLPAWASGGILAAATACILWWHQGNKAVT